MAAFLGGSYSTFGPNWVVMPGLVPGISIAVARPCPVKRDGRDKPGHDELRVL